jgi:predicted HTH transcriptional regulator
MLNESQLVSLLSTLCALPGETEWVEFKVNNHTPDEIGEYISALANSAALLGRESAYVVWGVEDEGHDVVGTTFRPRSEKVGNQELESWLSVHLEPAIDFRFHEFNIDGRCLVLLEIPPCQHTPVRWKKATYIRVGSYKKKLSDYAEKERSLWRLLDHTTFEMTVARQDVSLDEALSLLNFSGYYDLTKQLLPSSKPGILDRLVREKMVLTRQDGNFDITNYGAILFAKRLSDFDGLGRKAVRVITYAGNSRVAGGKEHVADEGYAVGFEPLIAYVNGQLPVNEHIGQALRVQTGMYPGIAIRELVANAVIHQDFSMTGDSPLVEVFTDRVEISNGGRPLIDPLRFVDEPPQSRNEALAAFMRRINICEERGSGIDKVIDAVELFQLPAPEFKVTENHTKVFLFAHREFREMGSTDRVRACYWHACLLHVSGRQMTNETLRKRFGLDDSKHNQVGRIIADAREAARIKPYDPENRSPRYARYVPFWA